MTVIMGSACADLTTAPFAGPEYREVMYACWRGEIMKQTHGIIFWLVVLFAICPTVDGMLTGAPADFAPSQNHWMDNLVVIFTIAGLILGMACIFRSNHA